MAYKQANKKQRIGMKPEVKKIFNELDEYRDYCRMYLLKFDEADLFKSEQWRRFNNDRKRRAAYEAREAKRQAKRQESKG